VGMPAPGRGAAPSPRFMNGPHLAELIQPVSS
jgi:hypothetical protein